MGERRLARLSEEFDVHVERRFLEIHPETPAEGRPVSELGYPPEQWADMMENLNRMGKAEGIVFYERTFTTNSHKSLLLAEAAKEEGLDIFEALNEGLFRNRHSEPSRTACSLMVMVRNGKATVTLGFVLSAIAITAAMGAGAGARIELWDFRQGFRILIAKRVPMIHDITTDTENPPIFVSVLALRKDAPNSAIYGGPEIAAKQHAAYPDIRPLVSDIPPAQAFERARSVAHQMCWKIVDDSPSEGRIEATATTRWFGFKDDVVIRIAPSAANGSRVDIRSVSRVGRSDVGTNTRRIRAFLKKFAEASKTGG